MSREHIVVTGGYGFIGSRFVKLLVENTDYKVVIIDKCTYAADKKRVTSWMDSKKHMGRVMHYIADISDPDLVTVCPEIATAKYVVNFAAESHVDNSIEDGSPFIHSNVLGVFNLLEICKENKKLQKFVQISTDEVYGDMEDLRGVSEGADEGFKLTGSSYYSASKASADLLVQACARTFGIPYLITRTCNNFGPNQHDEKFLPKLVKSIAEGKNVPVYGDGKQIREWMHVDDNVSQIYWLMLDAPANEVYNIGSGDLYENINIVRMVSDMLGKEVKYDFVADRLGHDRKYHLNSSKTWSFRGRKPKLKTLREFMREEVREYVAG